MDEQYSGWWAIAILRAARREPGGVRARVGGWVSGREARESERGVCKTGERSCAQVLRLGRGRGELGRWGRGEGRRPGRTQTRGRARAQLTPRGSRGGRRF